MLALLPAIDLGIFVTTLFLSTVTVEVTPVAKPAAVNVEGMEKFFGPQSSIKKPMVGANVGSTWGAIVVSTAGGGSGAGVSFLSQAENKNKIESMLANNMILSLVIIVV